MAYFKCKDCKYFEEKLIFHSCNRKGHYTDVVQKSDDVCCFFKCADLNYTCSKCKYYACGTCKAKSSFFVKQNYEADHPACSSFYPQNDCFLTSACVDFMGKPDDCEELTILRDFRDNYMKTLENCQTYSAEYYEIAPQIVERINSSDKKSEFYNNIYSIIMNCIDLIKHNKNEEALDKYRDMVFKLKREIL